MTKKDTRSAKSKKPAQRIVQESTHGEHTVKVCADAGSRVFTVNVSSPGGNESYGPYNMADALRCYNATIQRYV